MKFIDIESMPEISSVEVEFHREQFKRADKLTLRYAYDPRPRVIAMKVVTEMSLFTGEDGFHFVGPGWLIAPKQPDGRPNFDKAVSFRDERAMKGKFLLDEKAKTTGRGLAFPVLTGLALTGSELPLYYQSEPDSCLYLVQINEERGRHDEQWDPCPLYLTTPQYWLKLRALRREPRSAEIAQLTPPVRKALPKPTAESA